MKFTEENEKKFRDLVERYPDKEALILPALYLVQEQEGHVSGEVMEYLAERTGVSVVHVKETATFYTMYNKSPVGKYHIQLCNNIACMLRGSEEIIEHLKKKYEVKVGETTKDGFFTLSTVECLGACGGAPVVQINDDYHENMTSDKLDEILDKLS